MDPWFPLRTQNVTCRVGRMSKVYCTPKYDIMVIQWSVYHN